MDLRDDDGYRSESLLLKIIGLIYPQSFEVVLKPGKECYYVSYNYLKVNFDNKDGSIKGKLFEYGFNDWDGKNLNTCSFLRDTPLE
jgi:hypothetical protein